MIDKKSPTHFQVSDISYPTHGGNPQAIANTSGTDPDTLIDFSASINPLSPPGCVSQLLLESTVDGIIAPLFFAVLGGAPLAIAYKAINTMDSLFGYKNDAYLEFGWAPARLDDLANWFPARLALPVIAVSAALCGLSGKNSFAVAIRDGSKHPSPNSGFPEAAMAGALGIRLGGTSFYSGEINRKPFIGDNLRELELSDITQSQKIMFIASLLALAVIISIEMVHKLF